MKHLRFLTLALACGAALTACSSGTEPGDTNVERGSTKRRPVPYHDDTNTRGDSITSGTTRDSAHQVTGKELYRNADKAVDRNHDGIAD